MVIVISTMGSYGDFKPCLNLAKELISRGHKVRIITHKKYEPEAVENGLELFDNGCDLERFMKYVANITKYDDDNTDDDDDYSLEEYKDSIINATEKPSMVQIFYFTSV